MTALIVLGCVMLALILIGQIRVGAAVEYSEAGLLLALRVGPVRVQLYPMKKRAGTKETKPKRASKHPADSGAAARRTSGKDTLKLALRFVPLLGEAAGRFKRKIRIDRLSLRVIWAASDPATAAMGYGAGNAALGMIWPVIEHNFKVKDRDLRVDVDFERKKPELEARAQATLTIAQGVTLAVSLGWKALKLYLGYRREQKNQKAVQCQ